MSNDARMAVESNGKPQDGLSPKTTAILFPRGLVDEAEELSLVTARLKGAGFREDGDATYRWSAMMGASPAFAGALRITVRYEPEALQGVPQEHHAQYPLWYASAESPPGQSASEDLVAVQQRALVDTLESMFDVRNLSRNLGYGAVSAWWR